MSEKKELNNNETSEVSGGGILDQRRCSNRKCKKVYDAHENYFYESHGCGGYYYWKCPYCGNKEYN